ncbi:hypothetical protein ACFWZT_32910 [Streptomyces alboflavus]|uniref:hypothetical protein n=1 Tax=Streptomyces alboflavus TaxID=67267 RepID=UPI0036C23083
MTEPSRPQELPARLLTDPEMIKACRVRDIANVFRLVKVKAGVYPSMIGKRCGLTPSRVGEVMARRRQLQHMDVIERISDGLRIPGHMLGLARRPWETPQALEVTERKAVQEQGQTPQQPATLPGPDVDSILAMATCTSLSPATLEAFRSSIEDYWRRDDQHGGEALRPAIVGQLRYVVGLLKENRPLPIQNGLYSIAAELARLTGWTYFDARQYNQARAYFTQALQLAKEIDDRQFMANVLACMSLQATYQDKPADALAFVSAAQDQARSAPGTTPRVLAMLAMRGAFAHATLGSKDSTHRALGDAYSHFEQIQAGDADPSWVAYFGESKLIVDTGIAHARLGEAATAEPLITDALRREDRTNQRGRAFHSFWLARTQLDQGKLEQACQTATQALEPASAVASERVSGHLTEFYGELAPYRDEPIALAFEAQLRAHLPLVSGSTRP